jgi:chemotaxis-related protein WspB
MLYLVFQLGTDSYALDARHAVEVLPVVDLKHVPRAPASVAGVLNYHGVPVPVLDLSELVLGRSSALRMNTRIVITHYEGPSGRRPFLALLTERATDMLRREEADFLPSGLAIERAAYLGPVIVEAGRLVQRLEIEHLVPHDLREQLFTEILGAG